MDSSSVRDLIVIFFVFGGGFWVLAPLAQALAKRIGSPPHSTDPAALAELQEQLQQVRQELAAERTDFTERLLAKQHAPERLPPTGQEPGR
jgi:hypothetical protein